LIHYYFGPTVHQWVMGERNTLAINAEQEKRKAIKKKKKM